MEKLQREIKAFISKRNWSQYHTPKNLAMALSVETAELLEIFQWLTPEQSSDLPPEARTHLEEEIGDIMIISQPLLYTLALTRLQRPIRRLAKTR